MRMNCREIEEFVLAYIDGELRLRVRLTFNFHLAMCPECRAYLRKYRTTRELVRSIHDRRASAPQAAGPDEPIPERLIEAILAARRDEPGGSV